VNQHLHPIFQQALAPFAPPTPEEVEANERLRDKIWDEHASGLDGGDDEGDDE
jgi:hypothetical protein